MIGDTLIFSIQTFRQNLFAAGALWRRRRWWYGGGRRRRRARRERRRRGPAPSAHAPPTVGVAMATPTFHRGRWRENKGIFPSRRTTLT
jgi:hypothetical protein